MLLTGDIVANEQVSLILGPFKADRQRACESAVSLMTLPAEIVGFGPDESLFDENGARIWLEFGLTCQGGSAAPLDPFGTAGGAVNRHAHLRWTATCI